MKKGFVPGETVNLAPFADYTISTMITTDYGFTEDKAFFIRPHIDYDSALYREWEHTLEEMQAFLVLLVDYSIDVVTLSDWNPTCSMNCAS